MRKAHQKMQQKFFIYLTIVLLVFSNFAMIPVAGAEQATLTVKEARSLDHDGSEQTVEGYIVGHAVSEKTIETENVKADTNLVIADEANQTDLDKVLIIQLPQGDLRTQFGLKSNPDNIGKKVLVRGKLERYFSNHGLKNTKEMSFVDELDPEESEAGQDKEVEVISIKEARDKGTGEVTVTGLVTAKLKNTLHIQDESAGLAVRPTSLDVQVGDEVLVTGHLQDYRGLLQLDSAKLLEKKGKKPVTATEITAKELNEANESKLVKLNGVTLTDVQDGGNWANYEATDGTNFTVRDETNTLDLVVGQTYDEITGIVTEFDGQYQLIPRNKQDVIADDSVIQPVYSTPASGTIPKGTEVELKTNTKDASIYYTLDQSEPTDKSTVYTEPLLIDEDTVIQAVAIKDGVASEVQSFEYQVYESENLKIHAIQGEGHESPLKGTVVEGVEGVVTYTYDIRGAHYFHLQAEEADYDDNPNTSEAVIVYTGKDEKLAVGTKVKVSGKVDEYHIDGYDDRAKFDLSVTQINARDDRGGKVEVLKENVELPEAIKVKSSDIPDRVIGEDGFDTYDPEKNAIDYWESLEGMRVEIAESKAVAPQEHGDLAVVTEEFETNTVHGGLKLTEEGPASQIIQFKLQPNGPARDLAVKTGDRFTEKVTGVVNYGFGNYKVYAELEDIQNAFEEGDTQPQTTTIKKDDEKLTIAAYNVENFSANKSAKETPDAKAENIARAISQDMQAPDIVGLTEVQDNNGQDAGPNDADASESFKRLIKEIEAAGGPTYDFVNINPEYNQDGGAPNGNIRVGYLYNPQRVSLTDGEPGSATEKVEYKDGKLSVNPGRINPSHSSFKNSRKPLAAQFEFEGESIVVIANHLNSKRGDQGTFGQHQPPKLISEAQRLASAKEIAQFVDEIKTENESENVVVLGDMNDFEFSPVLKTLEGEHLTNMINKVALEERYTYVFQGNSQVLDHILVSNELADTAEVDILHVNADFTEMHNRASDHEPVLVQLDVKDSAKETEKDDFDLTVMHMNDTHANVDKLPKMITAIKDVRQSHENNLLFHAGDVFSGTLYFNKFKGQADLALMNLMDIDAMVYGNHEFDLGSNENGHESLAKFVKGANFPLLGTNIDFTQDPFMKELIAGSNIVENPAGGKSYEKIIKEVDGEKIGIFGLTTEDTIDIASPMNVEFNNYLEIAENTVKEFEAAGIDKIVAVTHLGYDSNPKVGNDLQLAKKVSGIDIVVGGHSHTNLSKPTLVKSDAEGKEKAPTVVVQAEEYGNYLGKLDVTFDENGEIKEHSGELIPTKDLVADAEAEEILKPFKEEIEELKNRPSGAVALKDLKNPRLSTDDVSVRANETELGNLVTDAMLAKAQEKFPETQIALQNGGGIRAAIDKGEITIGEIIAVLPFGNDPVIAEVTGKELREIFEHSVHLAPNENGGFLHVSGMKLEYDSSKPEGERVVSMALENKKFRSHDTVEIKDDETYTVTTNQFTAGGGDGFETFAKIYADGRVKNIGEIDWEQLQSYMVDYLDGQVDPEIEGRITDLAKDESPTDPEGGETPTDPEGGETPTDPEGGETPTDPEGGETPTDPEGGETPTDPEGGETPTDPEGGETPTDPEGGETPTDPEGGETPTDPEGGETPTDPEGGETPTDPEGGETPTDPEGGETPTDPEGGETPTDPEGGETPTDPEGGETPTDPEGGETPTDPEGGETPTDPEGGETPTDPEGGETPTDPEGGETPGEDGEPGEDGKPGTDLSTGGGKLDQKPVSERESKEEAKEKLPKTATTFFTIATIGFALLIIGLMIASIRRRINS